MFEPVLTKRIKDFKNPVPVTIEEYVKTGGYEAAKKALTKMKPEEIIDEVKSSNLRGRGGAGFSTGLKWSFIPKNDNQPHYLLCNADESEPGTFKDRLIIDGDPHMLIEGMIISAYAIRANQSYIYIRGEFVKEAQNLEKAIQEAYDKGFLGKNIFGSGFDLDMAVHRGAGAYVCGEETGLIESLEGKRGWPRLKPPFPAIEGAFRKPTIVNNVETLACVPHIIERGADWFKSIGPESGPGPKLYCLSGHVNNPGVFELPMGANLKDIIYEHGKGIWKNRKLKAVIPGGSSVPVLTADEVDIPMDFESVKEAGSMLGSAGIIVMDDSVCMVDAIYNLIHFYRHESCGQCTPCREGTSWAEKLIGKFENGTAKMSDIDLLEEVANHINFRTICPLGDAAAMPIQSFLEKFRHEFEEHVKAGKCPYKS
ncbi:MAG: NADH-quinone oxidoreductase subunit NuoF [Calditrichia bacterium]